MDTISAVPSGSVDPPIHNILLGAWMVIVENLTNPAGIPKQSFVFFCLPLKIKDADGSPMRAVVMVP